MFSAQANENSTELSESVPRSFIRGTGGGGRGGGGDSKYIVYENPFNGNN